MAQENGFVCNGCDRRIVMQLPIVIGGKNYCNGCAEEQVKKK